MITLIMVNVICFIVGTVFVASNNNDDGDDENDVHDSLCYTNDVCDMIFFGNFLNNGLGFLQIGATSLMELTTVFFFTLEYVLRFSTAHYLDPVRYGTFGRRLWYYVPTFHSLIDLLSIVPFYIDAFLLPNVDLLNATNTTSTISIIYLLRMLRLLRMMRIDNTSTKVPTGTNTHTTSNHQNYHQRYNTALSLIDDVIQQQADILLTTSFVGITIWIILTAGYYLTERGNLNMIYCPVCYHRPTMGDDYGSSNNNWTITTDTFDPVVDCRMDEWGSVDCTNVSNSTNDCHNCYHRFESIPMASYYTLLNLMGEYPLIQSHSVGGKVIAALTAIVAVAVFAIPVGIVGNGLQTVIQKQQRQQQREREQRENTIAITTSTATIITTTEGIKGNDSVTTESESMIIPINNHNTNERDPNTETLLTPNFVGNNRTTRGQIYNIFHSRTYPNAMAVEIFINLLIIATVLAFMMETVLSSSSNERIGSGIRTLVLLDSFELISVIIFTLEYGFRIYSITEDPKYQTPECNRFTYMRTFLPIVDAISFAPYWIEMIFLNGTFLSTSGQNGGNGGSSMVTKSLRLLRILRFERYTHAFTTFDDVIIQNIDILTITAVTAMIFWIVFSTLLYYTERNSDDAEIAANYNHIPNAMWITLLNLSGEAPLSQYSMLGKVITAILGLFATGIFGIPIGVLGAGFERIVTLEHEDNVQELVNNNAATAATTASTAHERSTITVEIYKFVNGIGSIWARWFEGIIYIFILLSVAVGVWQTVDGHVNDFHQLEWMAVIVFTVEYVLRLIGAGADPEFNSNTGISNDQPPRNHWSISIWCRLRFISSFYSVIDLLAIVPFYIAFALPNTFVNDFDEYFRMIRIVRLLKLDKYIPSISLIDDVIRLKFNTLRVAFYAAVTLWILFAAALYVCEHDDTTNAIDPVPKYGCRTTDCTMSDRFQNFFDSMVYTGIHLTGDYPIITYSWSGRVVNFFMVIAAVGVVSIPSGLIASGFVEIVRSKNIHNTQRSAGTNDATMLDDDWYEVRYRSLAGSEAPISSGVLDQWQIAVDRFLNGQKVTTVANGVETIQRIEFGYWASRSRMFIFVVIILNVLAVIMESVPSVDKYVGNEAGNFFDVFELFSVLVFATEYILRLFSAPKNREALYSTLVYATTFFGIVDFLSTAPWFIEQLLIVTGAMDSSGDFARVFRIFRIFRIFQLEDFITAFSKLDNVFRESKDVLKATGLMAFIVWIGCGALFFIFEENNPNWRTCDSSIQPFDTIDPDSNQTDRKIPGCYDFPSTTACNEHYPGMCQQHVFSNMPDALYYTAIFLGGEWGVVDFTWPGRIVCLLLCVVGIGLYSIPIGTLFDSFGKVLGLDDDEEEDDDENS